jgi:REP element-mobilizing transposase RayT
MARVDRKYQVWKGGFHPKQVFNDEVMWQKLEYIHNNPVKRGYVEKQEEWRYSSVHDYLGKVGPVPVTLFNG